MKKTWSLIVLSIAWLLPVARLHAQTQAVKFTRTADHIEVMINGKPFTTYYFDPAIAKAYLQPLRSAQGTIVTRGFPVGDTIPPADYHDPSLEPHQRPLYFAHGNIDGNDFWGEAAFRKFYGRFTSSKYGRMAFRKLDEMQGGDHSGRLRAEFDLLDSTGRPIGEETQQYTFEGNNEDRIIDCEYLIHADHGPVKMGDTKEGTFAIRVAPELQSPPGHMVNSEGGEGEPQIWGKRANWVDYDGTIDGENLGIAVFDSPRSFRHPTYWHARAYGLFAANPFGWKEFTRDPHNDGSYTIPAGQSITFRYRVLIHHGDYQEAKVAEAYSQYEATQ